jgi:hypothetical protein
MDHHNSTTNSRTIVQEATILVEEEFWVVLQLPGYLAVLPRTAFKQAIRRGKWYRRHQAMRARLDAAAPSRNR